jgi:hypothetical protein
MSSPHIIIIGGGVGGLALAQNFKKRGISFTLFERDASPASRAQGYRIRVAGRGAEALRECLDNELLNLFEKTCAETKPRMSGAQLNAIDGTPIQPLLPKETYDRSSGQGPPWMKRSGHSYTVDRTEKPPPLGPRGPHQVRQNVYALRNHRHRYYRTFQRRY